MAVVDRPIDYEADTQLYSFVKQGRVGIEISELQQKKNEILKVLDSVKGQFPPDAGVCIVVYKDRSPEF